jgi:RecB family exonuclease
VIAPSHAAALQLRRRLAEIGPFAAVRFEPLPRIAELLGAGPLDASGRAPLARPIGDYVTWNVARESQGALATVADLTGYARVLRQLFRRLRRGGVRHASQVPGTWHGHLPEVLRLYQLFRDRTAKFYDEEDLLDAATDVVRAGSSALLAEFGQIWILPPGARSAGAASLVEALVATGSAILIDEAAGTPDTRFVLATDPASEAREAVREVVRTLEAGVAIHEIAIFYGADPAYRHMLLEMLDTAGIPATSLPGTPLVETAAGRAVLGLAELPGLEYARGATMDMLGVAPLRPTLPVATGDPVRSRVTAWDRLSREAGITRGLERWRSGLEALAADQEARLKSEAAREHEGVRGAITRTRDESRNLRQVIEALASRLEPLRVTRTAVQFIDAFKLVVHEYLDPRAPGLEAVTEEIEQLGTVAAVGGTFTLDDFARALRANLEAVYTRERRLGDGVLVADYRAATGMRFRHVVLCGAREDVFPAGPGDDALVEDEVWATLRETLPYIEDATLRIERAREAATRAVTAARGGTIVWCAPLYGPSGTREYYPSPLMVEAAGARDAAVRTGSGLRHHAAAPWLRRGSSPLALRLSGPPVDAAELRLREAVAARREGKTIAKTHPRARTVEMIRARSARAFSEWDGNLSALAGDGWLVPGNAASPTSLEAYGTCGFRYLGRSLLRLNAVEEPDEREMLDPASRGTLVHGVLEAFFRERQVEGRPVPGEAWTDADRIRALALLDDALDQARARGLTGLEIFGGHQRRMLRADLEEFLDEDTIFRQGTGAVPSQFEAPIPENTVAGIRLRGYADRIDRTPDGSQAWVIDYKTGSPYAYEDMEKGPLVRGTHLQLPAYLLATTDAAEAHALYWFISRAGGFEQINYEPTPERQQAFEATVAAILDGIRSGAFPAVSGEYDEFYRTFANCGYCEYTRICSRRRDDAFTDMKDDPGIDPWLAVERAAGGSV